MTKTLSLNLSAPQPQATMFGAPAERIAEVRRRDPLFDELVEDYLTIASALRQKRPSESDADSQFWMDSLATLHALDTEIRNRLSQVEQSKERELK